MGALILAAGYLAAGKTTYSEKISGALSVPRINKDEVKERLTDALGFKDRAENKALSLAAIEVMLYCAERLLACNVPVIVESNFHAGEGERFVELAQKYKARTLTLKFTGDIAVCYERFDARFKNPLRHYAHKSFDFSDFETFKEYNDELGAFCAGDILDEIDATAFHNIDTDALIGRVKKFIQTGE